MNIGANRQSNFELLRILSMFFIIFYHFLLWFVYDNSDYDWIRAFWIPLHIGVICFILISGYWGIRPSSRGFLLFVGFLLFYSIPDIVYSIKQDNSIHGILHAFMFVSRSKFWFARTYLGLFLIAPLLNHFFENSSIKGQWYLLIVLSVISIYFGNFTRNQAYLEGKNLINFMLIYQIGHILQLYSKYWKNLNQRALIISYLFLNSVLVLAFLFFRGSWLGDTIWRLSFPYNSPILILNSVLLFIIIGQLGFHSSVINGLAENCFAIYLIHSITPLVNFVERPLLSKLFYMTGSSIALFVPLLFGVSILVLFVCASINQLFRPLWKGINQFGGIIQTKIGF